MIRFGACALDTVNYVVHRNGQSIQLSRKIFEVLRYLLEHRNRVVSKQELSEQFWPGQDFSDAALESTMKLLRKAVGDSGRKQRYVRTFRGLGYRFVAAAIEVEGSDSNSSHTSPAQDKELRSLKYATILVVDDDPAIVELLSDILSPEGFNILTTNNGVDAVEIAIKERPDMVILDINMGHMSGFEILDAIKKRIETRVILFSGIFGDTDTAVASIKSGADDFFTKPFQPDQILVKVKRNLIR